MSTPTVITQIPCVPLTDAEEQYIVDNGLDRFAYAYQCAVDGAGSRMAAELTNGRGRSDNPYRVDPGLGSTLGGYVFGDQFR